MTISAGRCSRRSLRTKVGRRAEEVRRAVGFQIVRLRVDAGISQRRLAEAAGIPQSYLSTIERGLSDPSIAVLVAIGDALGADLTIHLRPGTGPRIRDRLQAPIVEAILEHVHPSWRRLVEEPVHRPVRGIIDLVLARPEVALAVEVHSELRRLEQQIRWATEKSLALPSSASWSMITGGEFAIPISRLLVLRSTAANRDLARTFEATLGVAYPARAADAFAALTNPARPWPGAALLWAVVEGGQAHLLDAPPRGVALGR